MLYRIDRINIETGAKDYEYVLGKRALGKYCFKIMSSGNMRIDEIVHLGWSRKGFRICAAHTISQTPNRTAKVANEPLRKSNRGRHEKKSYGLNKPSHVM